MYTLYPRDRFGPFKVFCDMQLTVEGHHGWTVIQRRIDGSVNFDRTLNEYQYGFGRLNGSFWLGLENIKRLLDKAADGHQLYVAIYDSTYGVSQGIWDHFSLGSISSNWRIKLRNLKRDISSSSVIGLFDDANGRMFSTMDSTLDGECASKVGGGWWFGENCLSKPSPNGHFDTSSTDWGIKSGSTPTVGAVVMAIRPR